MSRSSYELIVNIIFYSETKDFFSYIHTKDILNQYCLSHFHFCISEGQKKFSFNFVQGKNPPQAKIF